MGEANAVQCGWYVVVGVGNERGERSTGRGHVARNGGVF